MQTSSKSSDSVSSPCFKLLLLSVSLSALVGCQTTTPSPQPFSHLDLDQDPISADASYRKQLTQQTEDYQKLFAADASSDAKAKAALVSALQQQLKHNYVAVSETRMHETPFYKADSVDLHSQNAWITFLEGTFSGIKPFDISSLLTPDQDNDQQYDEYEETEEEVGAEVYDTEEYREAVAEIKNEIDASKQSADTSDQQEVAVAEEAAALSYYDLGYPDFFGPPYRTEEDFLTDPTALYLNYIDEKQGTLPVDNYSVTREEALVAQSHDNVNTVVDHISSKFDCVLEYSTSLDYVFDDYTDDMDEKHRNALLAASEAEYQACIVQTQVQEPEIRAMANVYQRQAITRENGCVSRFDKQISDYLKSDRSKDEDYDIYNSIWNSFMLCDASVFNSIDLEPVVYTSYYGWPQYFLDYKQAKIQCADEMIDKQQQAEAKGLTYNTNPQHYLTIIDEVTQCNAQARAIKIQYENENREWLLENSPDVDNTNDNYDSGKDYEAYKKQQLKELEEAIEVMKITPAQVEANNFYYYQYLTLNQISEYDAQQKQYNSVYSFDYVSPSSYTSIQLPLGIDFKQGKMILDPRALLPLVALSTPQNTPLPEEMLATTVAFGLPEDIQNDFPAEVIYDALISAIGYSMTELDSSNFTLIDASHDAFAKRLGAKSVIKVNLDAYQSGKMLGVIFKNMINTLQAHVEAHPEAYEDPGYVVYRLDQIQQLNTKYVTDDLGRLMQALETFIPITFNKINHFYLSVNNQLLGKQVSMAIGSDLAGRTHTSVTQTRYDSKSFEQDPRQNLFKQTFKQPAKEGSEIDGNAWLQQNKKRQKLLSEAESTRANYGHYNSETERFEEYESYDDPEDIEGIESIDSTDNMDYEPKISIVEYGNVNDPEYQDEYRQNDDDEEEQY